MAPQITSSKMTRGNPQSLPSDSSCRIGNRLPASLCRVLSTLTLTIILAFATPVVHAQVADRISICFGAGASMLVPLAKQRDFYAAEGIAAEMHPFSSGKQAMEAMFAGKCALSAAGETPVAHYSLRRNDFNIIATIAVSNNFQRLIVRNDRGIHTAADLRGRRIAVPEFTTAHYFLDMYLVANGLTTQEVTKVYLPVQEVILAFRRGDVDAAAHWEPSIQILAEEFGARVKVLTAPGLHVSPFLLVGNRDYLRKNPASVERVLRALLRAERYAREQPANTKALMARDYAVSASEIELLWRLNDFRVTFDQSLLFILENVARWEIGLMPPAQRLAMPNFLDFIYVDGMKAVKPAALTVIH